MTSLHDLMNRTPGLPCRLLPDAFFSDNSRERDAAVRMCRTCPLLEACAEYAIAEREPHGVWGGTTPADRRSFRDGRPWRFDEQGRLRQVCGTESAYRAHHTYRETPGPDCAGGDCVAAHDAFITARRRERLAEEHAKGGTGAGYFLHRRLGERACDRCKAGHREQQATPSSAPRSVSRRRSASGTVRASATLHGPQTGAQPLPIAS
ncbi:WhiB family transcriptional regulator [Streptomyces werraensis]|uniref:WhiB family transcriptional regulator n=1 Tax=Streptomyces werraensis TaxID=68284 RepID=UPI00343DCFB5